MAPQDQGKNNKMNRINMIALTLCGLSIATQSNATNGINLIGYGAESTLMGGADTAVHATLVL